jgi:thiol:disulfide interchange protein DsbC
MNTKLSCTVALLTLAIAGAARAAAPSAEIDHLKSVLKERFPEVPIEAVMPSPIPGMYEVDTATDIVYSDASGEHVIMGNMLETKGRQNLTALRWDERNTIDFATLPLDLAIKNVKGDGSRVLAVFSDPHCPFCQKLEKELEQMNNTTVYTFLFPIEQLHPGATKDAHALWCSTDRPDAWKKWMLTQTSPSASKSCTEDPLTKIHDLGDKLRVQSTPTVFLSDGRRVTGALPAAQLEERLSAVHATPAKSAAANTPAAPGVTAMAR